MRSRFRVHGLRIVLFGLAAATLGGFIVMGLWNWLIPAITGWHAVTFWQALGLLVLSRILFGGFRMGPRGGRGWRPRFTHEMTPEEREAFRQAFRDRHSCRKNPPPEPSSAAV